MRLVVLAGLVCLFASFTAFSLLRRAMEAADPRGRRSWLIAASVVTGSGVWATHFVAMLAFTPYLPVSYDALLTGVSVVVAIVVSLVGLVVAVHGRGRSRLIALGGAIVGGAVGSMHYVGMAAMQVPATVSWDKATVLASLLIGIGLGSLALMVGLRPTLRHRVGGSLLLTLGICGLHFTAMSAVQLTADPQIVPLLETGQRSAWLAGGIAIVTAMILAFGLAGSIVDQRLAARAVKEAERLRLTVVQLEATKRELEATGADLTKALEAAAAGSQAKSQFLATMSHELRTPLNAVIGFSQMLASEVFGPLGDSRYREYARTISDSGTHLLNLINDILDFSKSEAGRLELADDEVDLTELVSHTARILSGQAKAANVAVTVVAAPALPFLRADERRVRQVLLNLLSNAIKFTRAGGKVVLNARCEEDGLAVDVADTGIGIAPENVPKALERFGQVDGQLARKYEGTGLGLPLSKRLMELHGGTLELESTPGVGTTVTIVFPGERILGVRHAA